MKNQIPKKIAKICFMLALLAFMVTYGYLFSISPAGPKPSLTTAIPQISKLIHMTMKDKVNIPEKKVVLIEKWKSLNPGYELVLYDDKDMDTFVKEYYPEFYKLYDIMPDIVEKADIWRYLIVHKYGGMYSDSDFMPKIPIDDWVDKNICKNTTVMVSMEGNGFLYIQWGFYSAYPGHQVFYDVVSLIRIYFMEELQTGIIQGDAVQRTGPLQFSRAIWYHVGKSPSAFDISDRNKIQAFKDICVLGTDFQDNSLAQHLFDGSWKNDRIKLNNEEILRMSEAWKKGLISI